MVVMQSLQDEEPQTESNDLPIWLKSYPCLNQLTAGFLGFVCHFNTLQSLLCPELHLPFTTILEVDGVDVVING